MPRRDPRRNISRVEAVSSSGTPWSGWMVRVQRRGRYVSRFFNDARHEGKMDALRAAKQFRDAAEERDAHWSVTERAENPPQNNVSGTVGVRRVRQRFVRDGSESRYWFWVAQWTDGHGRRKTRAFSVNKHGEDEAYELAVAARMDGVRKSGR